MSSTSQRYGHLAPAWTRDPEALHSILGATEMVKFFLLLGSVWALLLSLIGPVYPLGSGDRTNSFLYMMPPHPQNFRRMRPGLSQSSLPGKHSWLSHIATGNLLITCSVKFLSLVCSFFIFLSITSCSSSFPVFQAAFRCLCVDGSKCVNYTQLPVLSVPQLLWPLLFSKFVDAC